MSKKIIKCCTAIVVSLLLLGSTFGTTKAYAKCDDDDLYLPNANGKTGISSATAAAIETALMNGGSGRKVLFAKLDGGDIYLDVLW